MTLSQDLTPPSPSVQQSGHFGCRYEARGVGQNLARTCPLERRNPLKLAHK